jgi:hypothetical protein
MNFKNLDLLVRRIFDYFSLVPKEFERLKELEEEIRHFKNIKVSLKDIDELNQKIDIVRHYKDPSALEKDLDEKFTKKEISLEQYKEGIKQAAQMVKEQGVEYQGKRLKIKHIANHYYIPLILSNESERIDFIKHIIQTPSEVSFINDLEKYLESNHRFKEFDWWLFSKIEESLDEVCIPYYNPKTNTISHFKPDFIFWLKKGEDYFIAFVDPKGIEFADYQHKIDGYSQIFEENNNGKKTLSYDGLKVKVFTFLYTGDKNKVAKGYHKYWIDNMDKALGEILRGSQ